MLHVQPGTLRDPVPCLLVGLGQLSTLVARRGRLWAVSAAGLCELPRPTALPGVLTPALRPTRVLPMLHSPAFVEHSVHQMIGGDTGPLVTVHEDGAICVVEPDQLTDPLLMVSNHEAATWGVARHYYADQHHWAVVVSANSHELHLLEPSRPSLRLLGRHENNIPCVAFSPCGRFVASASIDTTVCLWSLTALPGGEAVPLPLARLCLENEWSVLVTGTPSSAYSSLVLFAIGAGWCDG